MSYYARNNSAGNGATAVFPVSFPYIAQAHVHVYVEGVEQAGFIWPTSSTVQLASIPANGASVLCIRQTPIEEPLVQFVVGTPRASDLNLADLQSIYLTQELADAQTALEAEIDLIPAAGLTGGTVA